jgi:hypothetical protein
MAGKFLKASKFLLLVAAVLFVALFLLQGSPTGWSDAEENHCLTCHTTPRKLIGAVRELQKERPAPKVSTETEGEG